MKLESVKGKSFEYDRGRRPYKKPLWNVWWHSWPRFISISMHHRKVCKNGQSSVTLRSVVTVDVAVDLLCPTNPTKLLHKP